MPPKKQISKEQIIDKAFEFVRQKGYEGLSARILAKELNCSTQPIYASFCDMKELKSALVEKAKSVMMQYMEGSTHKDDAALLFQILGYVQFASEEKHLYQLIFSPQSSSFDAAQNSEACRNDLELNMLIYAHGIIMMKSFGTLGVNWEEIKKMIINAYEKFK